MQFDEHEELSEIDMELLGLEEARHWNRVMRELGHPEWASALPDEYGQEGAGRPDGVTASGEGWGAAAERGNWDPNHLPAYHDSGQFFCPEGVHRYEYGCLFGLDPASE